MDCDDGDVIMNLYASTDCSDDPIESTAISTYGSCTGGFLQPILTMNTSIPAYRNTPSHIFHRITSYPIPLPTQLKRTRKHGWKHLTHTLLTTMSCQSIDPAVKNHQ